MNKFTKPLNSWSATKKKEKIKHQTHPIIVVLVVDIEVPLHITIKFLCDSNTHLVFIMMMEMVLMTMMTTMMMMVMVVVMVSDDDDDCEPTLLFLP